MNEATQVLSTVSGGWKNVANAPFTSVSGGGENKADTVFASVSGGYLNTAAGVASSISGGTQNTTEGVWSYVAGGWQNTATGVSSSVSGGVGGNASGTWSTVVGGAWNVASGELSTVLAGTENIASGYSSVISSGISNKADSAFSMVLGGQENISNGAFSIALGGHANTASGLFSSITGGTNNTASGDSASVSGGYLNIASGPSASVLGGRWKQRFWERIRHIRWPFITLRMESILRCLAVRGTKLTLRPLPFRVVTYNTASFLNSSVSGGCVQYRFRLGQQCFGRCVEHRSRGQASSVLGGGFNVASEMNSTIIGQKENSFVGDSLNGQEGETDAYYLVSSGMANLSDYLSVDTASHTLTIAGANLAIVNGGDSTNAEVNGLGNIIIGYNENENYDSTPYNGTTDPDADEKTGSQQFDCGRGAHVHLFWWNRSGIRQ